MCEFCSSLHLRVEASVAPKLSAPSACGATAMASTSRKPSPGGAESQVRIQLPTLSKEQALRFNPMKHMEQLASNKQRRLESHPAKRACSLYNRLKDRPSRALPTSKGNWLDLPGLMPNWLVVVCSTASSTQQAPEVVLED